MDDRIILEAGDQKTRHSKIAMTARDNEGENYRGLAIADIKNIRTPVPTSPGKNTEPVIELNHTWSTSRTGFMESIKLIATNLWYEEGKYGRSVAVDIGKSRNKTLYKRWMLWHLISLSN